MALLQVSKRTFRDLPKEKSSPGITSLLQAPILDIISMSHLPLLPKVPT